MDNSAYGPKESNPWLNIAQQVPAMVLDDWPQDSLNRLWDSGGGFVLSFNLMTWSYDYISPGLQVLSGHRADDVVRTGLSYWQSAMHPDDGNFVWQNMLDAFPYWQNTPVEQRPFARYRSCGRLLHASTGEPIWVDMTLAPAAIDAQGNMLRVSGAIADINDIKTDNRLFWSYFLQLPDGQRRVVKSGAAFVSSLKLTPQELVIVRLLAEGLTANQMAEHLSRSVHTIKTQRKLLLRKTGAANSAELVRRAKEEGWLD